MFISQMILYLKYGFGELKNINIIVYEIVLMVKYVYIIKIFTWDIQVLMDVIFSNSMKVCI